MAWCSSNISSLLSTLTSATSSVASNLTISICPFCTVNIKDNYGWTLLHQAYILNISRLCDCSCPSLDAKAKMDGRRYTRPLLQALSQATSHFQYARSP